MTTTTKQSQPQQQQHEDIFFRVRSLVNTENDPEWSSGGGDNIIVTNCDSYGCEPATPNILFDPDSKIPIEYTCLDALEDIDLEVDQMKIEDSLLMDDMFNPSSVSSTTTRTETKTKKDRAESFVTVDYEAVVPIDADLQYNEQQLQWRILLAAVQGVGLTKCNFQMQRRTKNHSSTSSSLTTTERETDSTIGLIYSNSNDGGTVRTRRKVQVEEEDDDEEETGLDSSLTIYAIQNDFEASAAYQNRKFSLWISSSSFFPLLVFGFLISPLTSCIPIFSFFFSACHYFFDDPMTQCMPVRTVLRLKYEGDPNQAEVVQSYMHDLLEKILVERTKDLIVGDVTKLFYVGTHDFSESNNGGGDGIFGPPPGSSDDTNTITARAKDDENGAAIRVAGFFMSASAMIVLGIIILVFRRRRRSDSEDQMMRTKVMTEDDQSSLAQDLYDMESGGRRYYPHTIGTNRSLTAEGISAITASSSSDSVSATRSGSSDDNVTAFMDDESDESIMMIMMDNEVSSIFRNSTGNSSIGSNGGGMGAPSSLPPRPHGHHQHTGKPAMMMRKGGGPPSSNRRRRKKKKKSLPLLQRTSSRECVHAMDAILEGEDDDEVSSDNDDEESGSEYDSEDEKEGLNATIFHDNSSSSPSSSGYNTPVGPGSDSGSPNTRQRFPSDPADSSLDDTQQILESLNTYPWGVADSEESTNDYDDNSPNKKNDDKQIERVSTLKTSNASTKAKKKKTNNTTKTSRKSPKTRTKMVGALFL